MAPRDSTISPDMDRVFQRGGTMGALIRSFDWSKTPLGPIARWPISLKTIVGVLLASRFPKCLFWGPELCNINNDAYRPILGDKHPASLGASARAIWPEIWPIVGPQAESVLAGGSATWNEHLLLPMNRKGYLEETYFTFSYSPVPDDRGEVGGVLVTCQETTDQVQDARQLQLLQDLSAQASQEQSAEEVCRAAARALSHHPEDVPYALLYLIDESGTEARLSGAAGFEQVRLPEAATRFSLTRDRAHESLLPLAELARPATEIHVLELPVPLAGALLNGRSAAPRALILPLARLGQAHPSGFLVAGMNPLRELDARYRNLFRLTADRVAAAIAGARALQHERQRAEALAEVDRAKTAFFSNVSHELRTPLTLMLAPIEDGLADEVSPLPPAQRERQVVVRRNALRLLKLVNAILNFSRVEAGRVQAAYEATDVAAFTSDIASGFRSAIESAGLALVVDCQPPGGPVFVDREMWETIVLNLLSNALKFTFEGQVRVTLQPVEHGVRLSVADTGVGIPEDQRAQIFDRFHRVRGARSRTYEGAGIGLALVKELARLHGGTVDVTSQVGQGSTFSVTVPLGHAHLPSGRVQLEDAGSPAASASSRGTAAMPLTEEALRWLPSSTSIVEPATASPTNEAGGVAPASAVSGEPPPEILVADDNADMRDYLARLLGAEWRVRVAADGQRALELAQAHPPALVLADVMMPGLDGFALLRALRENELTRHIPVILLSARAGEEARSEGMQAGADDYVVKPFFARELVARIANRLELARVRERLRASEEKYRLLFEHMPAGFTLCRAVFDGPSPIDCIHEEVNPAFEIHTGLRAEAILHRPMSSVLPALRTDSSGWLELFGVVAATGTPVVREHYVAALGRWFHAVAYSPRRGYFAAVLLDISKQKQVEEQLRRALQHAEMFIGVLGHDLRNPLGSISAAAWLLHETATSEVARKSVKRLLKSAQRMERMISQLLDFTRIRLGSGLPLEPRVLDLRELARAVTEEVELAQQCSVETVARGDLIGTWDADRLAQVLTNLVTNACQHRSTDKPVSLEADGSDAHRVRLHVRNPGVIAPDLLPLIFEPLRQGEAKGGERSLGLGLGLYITQQIVIAHGGVIRVTSCESEGTRFLVELPRQPPIDAHAAFVSSNTRLERHG